MSKRKTGKTSVGAPRDITVDAVIRDLVSLFEYLGINSGRLANRVKGMQGNKARTEKTYTLAPAIGELLSWWHQDPQYLDEHGNPAPLKLSGAHKSFRRLADKAVPNIAVKQLVSELERVGAVSIDARGYVRAQMRALPVYVDRRFAVQHTLASLTSFIRTLRHNLDSNPANSDQLFHRIAWNNEFDPSELPKLKIWIKKQGQSFLESSDNWMMRRSRKSIRGSRKFKKPAQVSVGVYLAVDES